MSTIDDIRARLAACPIPEQARADWDGSNHFEINNAHTEFGGEEYWWLTVSDVDFDGSASSTEEGKRLGAVLDYAVAYRRDVAALLAEIDRLKPDLSGLRTAAQQALNCAAGERRGLGAVNWRRVHVESVSHYIADDGYEFNVVLIVGADPKAAELQTFMREKLKAAGWDAEVRTEW